MGTDFLACYISEQLAEKLFNESQKSWNCRIAIPEVKYDKVGRSDNRPIQSVASELGQKVVAEYEGYTLYFRQGSVYLRKDPIKDILAGNCERWYNVIF